MAWASCPCGAYIVKSAMDAPTIKTSHSPPATDVHDKRKQRVYRGYPNLPKPPQSEFRDRKLTKLSPSPWFVLPVKLPLLRNFSQSDARRGGQSNEAVEIEMLVEIQAE